MKKIMPTKREIEKLYKKGYFQRQIGERFGYTQNGISILMKKYGIKTRKNSPWSRKEEQIIRRYYLRKSKKHLLSPLPNRNWESIKLKALKLGLSRSKEEHNHSKEVIERLRSLSQARAINVKWNKRKDIAYVLGILDGDGYTDRKWTIGLETKSIEFARKFLDKLNNIGMNPNIKLRKDHNYWIVWGCSKKFVDWYLSLSEEKKFAWLLKSGVWKYIEGRYDSDGYLHPCGSPLICTHKDGERKFLFKLLSNLNVKATIQKTNGVWIRAKSVPKFFKNIQSIYPHKNYQIGSKIWSCQKLI